MPTISENAILEGYNYFTMLLQDPNKIYVSWLIILVT